MQNNNRMDGILFHLMSALLVCYVYDKAKEGTKASCYSDMWNEKLLFNR